MAVLPTGPIGSWTETRLTRFVEDWFRNHQLPATKAIQVDALMIGTQQVVAVADPADLSDTGLQGFSGPIDVPALTIGGNVLPGATIAYDQITASVNVTGTNSGTPTSVIHGSSKTYDGSPVSVEFAAPQVVTPSAAAGNSISLGFYDNAAPTTLITFTSLVTPAAANLKVPLVWKFQFTPPAGVHAYNIGSWVTNTTGTPNIFAAAGTGATGSPAYLRITKV